MKGIGHQRGKIWIAGLGISQEEVLLLHRIPLKLPTEVLFLAKQSLKANKDHHSPPEGVVVAEENDYPVVSAPEGSLQFHHKVRELKHGYKIILKQPIKLAYTPTIHSGYANQQKQRFCWNVYRK